MNLKIAVIGCGYWGRNVARTFHELGALSAISDPCQQAAGEMSEKFRVPARSFENIISDNDIQAVAITAPAEQHYILAMAAMRAGKHVFVEKPIALSLDHAHEMTRCADERGLTLMVGHLLQYHPVFEKLKEMTASGEFGRLQYVYSNRLNLGKIRREENVLWSFAPHDISMILALAGEEPTRVNAIGASFLHKALADVTTTHLSFPSGLEAHVFVSWLHPFKQQKLTLVGEKVMAVFDDGEPWGRKLQLFDHHIEWSNGTPVPVKAEGVFVDVPQYAPLKRECAHFLAAIASGEKPRTDGAEGLRVLDVLQAAQRSLETRQAVVMKKDASSPEQFSGVFVNETAVVDAGVDIGPGSKIWHFSHLLTRVTLGREVIVGQNVMIGPDVSIGNKCKIQNNVSLYNGVVLEEGVFCGPSCVFTNVNNPRAEIERKSEFRPTLVKMGATIGANATIVCGVTLGEYSFVGAGAVVTKDVPAHALVVGNPARVIGWMSKTGARLDDDLICPETGTRYVFSEVKKILQEVA